MLENKSTINQCEKVLGKSSQGYFFLPSKGSSFFAPSRQEEMELQCELVGQAEDRENKKHGRLMLS